MRCHVIFVFLVVSNVNVSGQGFYERLTETWSRWTGRGRSSRLLEGSDEIIATYERCYGPYGCFNSTWPFNTFPESPEKIEPTYCIYTRNTNLSTCHKLEVANLTSIYESELQPNKKILFIIHGYMDDGTVSWIQRMIQQALDHADINVITVDWSNGCGEYYNHAVANIKLIGVMLAHLILLLNNKLNVSFDNCHLVGHSLGAHLAGYTGQYLRNNHGSILGRITGLDPASPSFKNAEPSCRLDRTDAHFVDIIHTDADGLLFGFGLMKAHGDVDYYPNGGYRQTGCDRSVLDYIGKNRNVFTGLNQFLACNHAAAVDFFTESFNSVCPFLAVSCPSYNEFLTGHCQCNDGVNKCFYLGYKSDQLVASHSMKKDNNELLNGIDQPPEIRAYLITGATSPFCRYHYRVNVVISKSQGAPVRGRLAVQLNGNDNSSPLIQLNSQSVVLEEGKSYSHVVAASWLGSSIASVNLTWIFTGSKYNPFSWRFSAYAPSLKVNKIDVFNLETSHSAVLCDGDVTILSKNFRQIDWKADAECEG